MQNSATLNNITLMGEKARKAMRQLVDIKDEGRSLCLSHIAAAVRDAHLDILAANQKDLELGRKNGLPAPILERLVLDEERIEAMAAGVELVASLPDPYQAPLAQWTRPNGIEIERVRTPLGVVGVIYESRPNVTLDAASLCLKSANAVILRGGSDSFFSSQALGHAISKGLEDAGVDKHAVQIAASKDRAFVGEMLAAYGIIDVLIPRGGKSLTGRVIQEAKVPVLAHLDGIVHVYVHGSASLEMALSVAVNAKMRRTSICGAAETLLLDASIAEAFLPLLAKALRDAGCSLLGCARSCAIIADLTPAKKEDFGHEFLDAIMAIKIVDGLDDALNFIDHHGSHHTDCIIAEDEMAAKIFLEKVDSSIVMHNLSTQFADGGEFGMGAEIGISTGRIHARGPIGIEQLCCFKYNVHGKGQCRP